MEGENGEMKRESGKSVGENTSAPFWTNKYQIATLVLAFLDFVFSVCMSFHYTINPTPIRICCYLTIFPILLSVGVIFKKNTLLRVYLYYGIVRILLNWLQTVYYLAIPLLTSPETAAQSLKQLEEGHEIFHEHSNTSEVNFHFVIGATVTGLMALEMHAARYFIKQVQAQFDKENNKVNKE